MSVKTFCWVLLKTFKMPNFYLIFWCGNFVERQFLKSFEWIARNLVGTVPFHKISTPGNQVKFGILRRSTLLMSIVWVAVMSFPVKHSTIRKIWGSRMYSDKTGSNWNSCNLLTTRSGSISCWSFNEMSRMTVMRPRSIRLWQMSRNLKPLNKTVLINYNLILQTFLYIIKHIVK